MGGSDTSGNSDEQEGQYATPVQSPQKLGSREERVRDRDRRRMEAESSKSKIKEDLLKVKNE